MSAGNSAQGGLQTGLSSQRVGRDPTVAASLSILAGGKDELIPELARVRDKMLQKYAPTIGYARKYPEPLLKLPLERLSMEK